MSDDLFVWRRKFWLEVGKNAANLDALTKNLRRDEDEITKRR